VPKLVPEPALTRIGPDGFNPLDRDPFEALGTIRKIFSHDIPPTVRRGGIDQIQIPLLFEVNPLEDPA